MSESSLEFGKWLKVKLSKCSFIRKETKYFGFIIDWGGLLPDIVKCEVIREMSEPRAVKDVREFREAIGYYKRFSVFKIINSAHSINKNVYSV